MATLIPAHGTPIYIEPANGRSFTLEELQTIVGGYIEMCRRRSCCTTPASIC